MAEAVNPQWVRAFDSICATDIATVGGKTASLGEMISRLKESGIRIPPGFATTADAYWRFIEHNKLEKPLRAQLKKLRRGGLTKNGKAIRALFLKAEFSEDVETAIRSTYCELGTRYETEKVDVAVRSSATAEDLPEASFAGQQESFLNVRGPKALLDACRQCYASLFTDRAITYREHNKFDLMKVALSVGVQKMVRSDKACAGVAFTIDSDGKADFELYVMAEISSNIVLADEFAERFDGFSIGINDLTQLVLGVDRDSTLLRHVFDERIPAVTRLIELPIKRAHAPGRHVGICGQRPNDHPDFAEFLVRAGIDSISLNPDSLIDVRERIAKLESALAS